MDRFINFLVAQASRFFSWMFTTRNGLVFLGVMTFIVMMKFHPELLTQLVSNLIGGFLNLIGSIIAANQKSIEYLFCIALLCFAIVMMFRAIFGKKGGGATKK